MKKTFTKSIAFVSILLSCFTASAQQIDSISIIPSNPTPSDVVKAIAYTTFGSAGCSMLDSSISLSGNLLVVNACHDFGIMGVICNSLDTVELGQLAVGTYTLDYRINRSSSGTCPVSYLDSLHRSFTVSPATGINKLMDKDGLFLFPNPAAGEITISHNNVLKENGSQLVFYNVIGQPVKIVKLEGSADSQKVSIAELPQGTYFYRLESPSYTGAAQKINVVR